MIKSNVHTRMMKTEEAMLWRKQGALATFIVYIIVHHQRVP